MGSPRLTDEELEYMLGLYESSIKSGHGMMATYGFIARAMGRSESTISNAIHKLLPTTKLATAKLRAASSKLVDRLIAKAEVPDVLDILSRPNIGVLAPAVKSGEHSGQTGIFVSVNAESCGAVKVGIAPLYNKDTEETHGILEGSGADGQSQGRVEGEQGETSRVLEAHVAESRPRRGNQRQRQRPQVQGLQEFNGKPEAESAQAEDVRALRRALGL